MPQNAVTDTQHQGAMPMHEGSECRLVARCKEASQQLLVGLIVRAGWTENLVKLAENVPQMISRHVAVAPPI